MRISVVICGEDFTREDLRILLQGIRDQEQKFSHDKEMFMAVSAPELTVQEMVDILSSLKPPFKQGPIVLGNEGISGASKLGEERSL